MAFGSRRLYLSLLLVWLLMPSIHAEEKNPVYQPKDALLQLFEPREFVDATGSTLRYRLMKPLDYKPGKKYPLVVFLHGAGERGDDNLAQLKHAASDFADVARRREFPAYVLFPQCPKEQKWVDVDWKEAASTMPENPSGPMQAVKQLIDTMIETAGIDETRIYLTGISMGGYGTWDALSRYERLFAAAAPVCGGGDPKMASRFSDVPIWCFHGAKDQVVKLHRSQEMIDALTGLGAEPKLTVYPNAEHDSWTETYANPDLYTWMFAQVRP